MHTGYPAIRVIVALKGEVHNTKKGQVRTIR